MMSNHLITSVIERLTISTDAATAPPSHVTGSRRLTLDVDQMTETEDNEHLGTPPLGIVFDNDAHEVLHTI